MSVKLQPGDVVAVRGGGLAGELIRLGAALANKPNLDAHIAMMHHYDAQGIPWGYEGRPGGVGQVDMRPYTASHWTVNNAGQPGRTGPQRIRAAKLMASMEGTRYDWEAIGGDALADLHVAAWNLHGWTGTKPGEVVCSSFAAWLYGELGWDHPDTGKERLCQPGDWVEFMISGGYSEPLEA